MNPTTAASAERVFPGSASGVAAPVNVHGLPLAAILGVLALLAVLLVLVATSWGIGVSPDSTAYIEGARNLLQGNGYSSGQHGTLQPITHWPPFYSITLAGIGLLGVDPLLAARLLGAALFGANILLVGVVARSFGGPAAALVGSFLLLVSPDMLTLHAMAWTEPLFLLGAVLGLYLIAVYVRIPSRRVLVALSLVVGLAFLTRYLGAALVAAGVLSIVLLTRQSWGRRITDAAVFLVLSCGPLLVWVVSNRSAEESVGNRELSFHPPGIDHLKSMVATLARWLVPVEIPLAVRVLLSLLVITALFLFVAIRARQWSAAAVLLRNPLVRVAALFVGVYFALLLTSITFFDVHTLFDARILSPVYVVGVLVLSLALPLLFRRATLSGRRTLGFLLVAYLLASLGQSAAWAYTARRDGLAYTSRAWSDSKLVEIVRGLPPGTPIFSNAEDALYFHTDRSARSLPWKWDPFSRRTNPEYRAQFLSMLDELREGQGVLVVSNLVGWRDYLPSQEELVRECALELVYRGEDGAVYRAREADRCPGDAARAAVRRSRALSAAQRPGAVREDTLRENSSGSRTAIRSSSLRET